MSNAIKNRLWFLPVILLSLQCSFAQSFGPLTFNFDRSSFPVWDFSGPYQFDETIIGAGGIPVPVSFSALLEQDTGGHLRGSGTTFLTIGSDTVAASYKVTGNVSGGGHETRVGFSIRLTGLDVVAGTVRRFSANLGYRLAVDSTDLTLKGKVRGSLQVAGAGGGAIRSDVVSLSLPPNVDGSWSITFNALPLNKIVGTGTFVISAFAPADNPAGFPTSRILPAKLSGSFSARQNLFKVRLSGIFEGRGTSLYIEFNPETAVPSKLSGKILGQSVR